MHVGSHCGQDVDDLKSIDELETYIEESQVILIFLSKGCNAAGTRAIAVGFDTVQFIDGRSLRSVSGRLWVT